MVSKKIEPVVLFRISFFSALFLMVCLVMQTLTAYHMVSGNSEARLQVRAQFFPIAVPKNKEGVASKDFSQPTLHEFSQLNTFSPMYFDTEVNGLDVGMRDKGMIDEMLVRYYLETRYTQIPDLNEMAYRWGIGSPLYFLSTRKLYNDFIGKWDQKMASLGKNVITIHIKNIKRGGNSFDVDFDLYENLPDGQHRFKSKHVNLKFRYANFHMYTPIFSNPYGMIFTSLDESEIKSTSR